MEEQIRQAHPILHRYLFTVTTFSKLLAMFLFILLPFLGFYLGMQYQQKITVATPVISEVQKTATPTPTFNQVTTTTPTPITVNKSNVANFVNLTQGPANNLFFKSQIEAPPNYYITDDEMLSDFASQGGMAPPRLILMKSNQVLGSQNYFKIVTSESKNDCITIWSTMGMDSIESWVSLVNLNNSNSNSANIKLSSKENFKIGKREATVYFLSGIRNVYVGFLPIGDKDSTTYFFNSCNTNNKEDFLNVMRSIKFRGDLNMGN